MKLTRFPKATVYCVIWTSEERGHCLHDDHAPRSDKVQKPRFLAGLRRSVEAHPTTSMATLAAARSVHKSTISQAVKDLGMTSYTSGTCHLLTTAQKASRVEKGTSLLNWLKSHPGVVKVFSDECLFTVDKFHNSRNDRYIASKPPGDCPSDDLKETSLCDDSGSDL